MNEPHPQTPPSKLAPKTWFALILLGFAGQLAWGVENQYFNTFMYGNITR
jgi:hypothetical protein